MPLTLYYHPLSSFCHKVLIALYEYDIDFQRRVIDLSSVADRAELEALWPLCKFPVIRDHTHPQGLAESSVIIEYLDRFHGGGAACCPVIGILPCKCACGIGFSTSTCKYRCSR